MDSECLTFSEQVTHSKLFTLLLSLFQSIWLTCSLFNLFFIKCIATNLCIAHCLYFHFQ